MSQLKGWTSLDICKMVEVDLLAYVSGKVSFSEHKIRF